MEFYKANFQIGLELYLHIKKLGIRVSATSQDLNFKVENTLK